MKKLSLFAALIAVVVGCGKQELPERHTVKIRSVKLIDTPERAFDSIPGQEAPDYTLHIITDRLMSYTNVFQENRQTLPVGLLAVDETFPKHKDIQFVVLDVDSLSFDTVAVFNFNASGLSNGVNNVHLHSGGSELLIGCWVK